MKYRSKREVQGKFNGRKKGRREGRGRKEGRKEIHEAKTWEVKRN